MNPSDSEQLIIAEEEAGLRLDTILAQRFIERYSRTYFQNLIDKHLVLLNGDPIKKRIKPIAGDEIEIQFAITPEIDLKAEPIPLDIIFEDDYMIAVNKPVGMVVHPAVGNWSGTFVNGLLYHCRQLPLGDNLRPGIVHRLDKDTSGVLVAAKTIETQQKLTELFASRKVYKEYLAITIGSPGNQTIETLIGRHPVHRKQMAVVEEGKSAISIVETLKYDGTLSFAKIIIMTGRTHQIRVHMQHLGTPVLGDPVYGNERINKKFEVNTQLLHAHKLRFSHPITGKEIEFVAKPPKDFQFFIDKLSRHRID